MKETRFYKELQNVKKILMHQLNKDQLISAAVYLDQDTQ